MSQREEIRRTILGVRNNFGEKLADELTDDAIEEIIDLISQDRKAVVERVVEPLRGYKQSWLDDGSGWEWGIKTYPALKSIDKSLAIADEVLKGDV